MPSKTVISDKDKKAIEESLDRILDCVRSIDDVEILHECRNLFRQRVPLHLRAYAASALLLGLVPSAGVRAAVGKPSHARPSSGRAQADKASAPVKKNNRPTAAVKAPTRSPDQPDERQGSRRENRYRGEGVTLFMGAGRRQRLYARIALDLLYSVPGVGEENVGEVRTMDNYSFISIDPLVEEAVIAALDGSDFRGKPLCVNRARKKAEGQEHPATDQD